MQLRQFEEIELDIRLWFVKIKEKTEDVIFSIAS